MVTNTARQPCELAKRDRLALIAKGLAKRTKPELVGMILAIAEEHAVVARKLEDRLTIQWRADLLVADVSSAIDRATHFDERMLNRNFDVDWQAYAEVQAGLTLLVELGQLEDAQSLALRLMKDGSYQVECSDEGLMTDELRQCLIPVIRAVKTAGGVEAAKWAGDMQKADRVGFICDKELAELQHRP